MIARLAVCVAFVLGGCALYAPTPYQELNDQGGYVSEWWSPRWLSVRVEGNAHTSPKRVRDYALLQAAEKADEAGFAYFHEVDWLNGQKVEHQTSYIYVAPVRHGDTGSTMPVSVAVKMPTASLTVIMHETWPEDVDPANVHTTADILADLAERYKPSESP